MKNIVLFRNDDVRNSLNESLILLTNLFINYRIPITHAVEPANLTREVVNWLLDLKQKYPDLIEIIQHGFNHNLNFQTSIGSKLKKGEFGGNRNYIDQYRDIIKGKELMDEYFDDLWFPSFTFPYGARNIETIKALNNVGYKLVNGGISPYFRHQIFYVMGRLLKREYLFNRKISWNLRFKPKTNLFQIDFGLSIIKKYLDEDFECIMFSLEELKNKTRKFLKFKNIGIILHHRYHNTKDRMKLIEDYLNWIKSFDDVLFLKQEDIYNLFK